MPKVLLVKDVMSGKVVTIDPTSTVFAAARKMMDRDIGCLVVLRDRKIAGVVTKGDIVRETTTKSVDPHKLTVQEVMSHPAVATNPDTALGQAEELMVKYNLSKLLVVKEGKLVGVVTSTDLLRKGRPRKVSPKDVI